MQTIPKCQLLPTKTPQKSQLSLIKRLGKVEPTEDRKT